MATRRVTPPWDYLHEASGPSLESFELSRLNHAANLRKEIAALLEQWIEEGPRPSWRAGCARTTNCPSNRSSESMFFRKSNFRGYSASSGAHGRASTPARASHSGCAPPFRCGLKRPPPFEAPPFEAP